MAYPLFLDPKENIINFFDLLFSFHTKLESFFFLTTNKSLKCHFLVLHTKFCRGPGHSMQFSKWLISL